MAVLERELAYEGAQCRLMIAGAERERAERAIDLEACEGFDELVGVGRTSLGDAGGERLDRQVF